MLNFASKFGGDNQGTQDWLNETRNSIGGSTISSITGKSDYEVGSYLDFICKRVINPQSFSNIAMDFGSYFENVVRVYLSKILNTEIVVLGAVPYLKDEQGRLNAHYSMDGMFETNAFKLKGVNDEDIFVDKQATYLLEIKTPWSRELKTYKRDAKYGSKGACVIPKSYVEQIKMGLVVIEPCEYGLFADCLARVCELTDFTEDRKFCISAIHSEPRNTLTKILASGVTKVYVNDITRTPFWNNIKDETTFRNTIPYTLENHKELISKFDFEVTILQGPLDFGKDPTKILKYLKEDEKLEHQFSTTHIVNLDLEVPVLEDEPNLLGYIPWKLFDIYYGRVEKDINFMDPYKDIIKKISSILYECQDLEQDKILEILKRVGDEI